MVIYDSSLVYIQSATTIVGKIAKIDAIISALEDTAIKSAVNEHITEYSLDDGQSKIRTIYRGTAAVLKSIQAFEQLKQMYVNRLNGRVTRLVDGKNFIVKNNGI